MRRIYKYNASVGLDLEVEISMPYGSVILCVQQQNDIPQIWAIVDDSKPSEKRFFKAVFTGYALPENLDKEDYIGTIQLDNGKLVAHYFEKGRFHEIIS